MSTWSDFALPQLPAALTDTVSAVQKINGAISSALTIIKTTLDVVAALQISSISAEQAIIKAAVTAIEVELNALANEVGVYLLFVPVRKKVVLSPIVTAALAAAGLQGLPAAVVPPSIATFQSTLAATTTGYDPKLLAFFNGAFNATGGNAGYLRTVIESLADQSDPNRPQPADTDAVAGIEIVAGATDYLQILDFLANFKALFAPRAAPNTLEASGLPVPKNVKTSYVAASSGVNALLTWDTQDLVVQVPTLSTNAEVTQVAVLRSTDPKFMATNTVQAIFGPTPLTKGAVAGATTVVDIVSLTYTGLANSYEDTSTLNPATTYYYGLAYNLSLGTLTQIAAGSATAVGFRTLSNVVKLSPKPNGPPKHANSQPPDWIRTPSVVSIVPDLAVFLSQATAFLTQASNLTTGYGDVLKSYATFLTNEINSFANVAAQFTAIVNRLTGLLGAPFNVGVYERSFSGVGGNQFFVSDLTQALSPSNTDSKRPPFDNGEFVAGMVVLVVGPSVPAIQPIIDLVNTILGNTAASASSITQALAGIEAVVGTAEAAAGININFTASTAPVQEPGSQSVPLIGASDSATAGLNCSGAAAPANNPTFGDNFQPL